MIKTCLIREALGTQCQKQLMFVLACMYFFANNEENVL